MAGKALMGVAAGLSYNEAARWLDFDAGVLKKILETDPRYRPELQKELLLAGLYPLLRVYMAASRSWRAADWLYNYLRRREGEASAEDVLAEFPHVFNKIRSSLYRDEVLKETFDRKYPIGDQ